MSHNSQQDISTEAAEITALIAEAAGLQDSGQTIEAERALRVMLRTYPENIDVLAAIGKIAEAGHRHDEALDFYSRAVQEAPKDPEALANISHLHFILGNMDHANHFARRAYTADSSAPNAVKVMGDVFAQKGELGKAENLYNRAVRLKPNFAAVHNNLGNVLQQQGKTESAEKAFRRAIEHDQNVAQFHSNLGVILIGSDRAAEALEHFRKSIEIGAGSQKVYGNMAKAFVTLGRAEEALALLRSHLSGRIGDVPNLIQIAELEVANGNKEDAVESLLKALDLNPAGIRPHVMLCSLYRSLEQYEQSIIHGRQAVEVDPDNAESHIVLARVLAEHGARDDAEIHFQRTLALEKDNIVAHVGMAAIEELKGNYKEAEEHYLAARALEDENVFVAISLSQFYRNRDRLRPARDVMAKLLTKVDDNASVHLNYASILLETNEYSNAYAHLEKAMELNPEYPEAYANLGIWHQQMGDLDAAGEAYKKALQLRPDFPEAMFAISFLGSDEPDRTLVDNMISMVEDDELSNNHKSTLCFAIGNSLDRLGETAEAFQYLTQGNQIEYEKADFELARFEESVARIEEVFTPEFYAERSAFGSNSTMPIFIVGLPRSGTTLVEQIISSHPSVFGAGELTQLADVSRRIAEITKSKRSFPEGAADLTGADILRLSGTYMRHLRQISGGAPFVTDKMPFNYLRVGLIKLLFPKAKIIVCRRDPKDIFISGYGLKFKTPIAFTSDQAEFAAVYKQFDNLTTHWDNLFPNSILSVQYESLVANQERDSRAIIEYCDLDWDDRCLEFYKSERPVKTGSNVSVRRPISSRSVGRWQQYKEFLGPLLSGLAD